MITHIAAFILGACVGVFAVSLFVGAREIGNDPFEGEG